MSSAWDNAIVVGAWAPKSLVEFENGPCGKGCPHMECLRDGGDHLGDGSYVAPWECSHGSWLMAQTAPTGWTAAGSTSRSIALEWDSPATAAACVRWLQHRGCLSFGDITFLEDMRYYATETPEVRVARKQAEALRDAADATKVVDSKVARKEEKWTASGSMKFRVPRPCKYASLFQQRICANCSSHLPVGQDTCSAPIVMVEEQERRRDGRMAGTGKMVARQASPSDSGVRPCGERLAGCWNHDQHKTCIYVHPDEPQWPAACAGTLRVKTDNRLVFCMAGEEGPSPSSAATRDFTGRFSGLVAGKPVPNGSKQNQKQSGGQRQSAGRW